MARLEILTHLLSLTLGQFPGISRIAIKFANICRFWDNWAALTWLH